MSRLLTIEEKLMTHEIMLELEEYKEIGWGMDKLKLYCQPQIRNIVIRHLELLGVQIEIMTRLESEKVDKKYMILRKSGKNGI